MLGGMRRAAGQGAKRVVRGMAQKSTQVGKGIVKGSGQKVRQPAHPVHKTTEHFNPELRQALLAQEKQLTQTHKAEMKAQKEQFEAKLLGEQKEKNHFKSLYETTNKKVKQLEKVIGNLRQQLDANIASVTAKTKEIVKLTKEISRLENKLTEIRSQMNHYKKMADQQIDSIFESSKQMNELLKDVPEFLSTTVRVNMAKYREAMDKVQAILKAGNIDKLSEAHKLPKDKQKEIEILLKKAEVSMEKTLDKIQEAFTEYKEIAPNFIKNGPIRRIIDGALNFADNKVAKAAKMWEWAAKFVLLTYGVSAASAPLIVQYFVGQEKYQTLCDTAEKCKNACGQAIDALAVSITGTKDEASDKNEALSETHEELQRKKDSVKAEATTETQSTSRRVVGSNQQASNTEGHKHGS